MSKKIGEYYWTQISMWDFSPKNCIEKYVRSKSGSDIFHYYLLQVSEIISDRQWKTKTVTDIEEVPTDIFNEKAQYCLTVNNKSITIKERNNE